ncbi:MAG: DUF423 domain-containing protein [Planctomycetales bacterium]|nr:DUF423 domain-containing protein [Planctomycetales bacterium]
MNARFWIAAGGLLGCASVALGAFGAHGLPRQLAAADFDAEQIARRLDLFQTAARYQMYTALALLFVGLFSRQSPSRLANAAGWLLLLGVAIFSGLLDVMTFAGPSWNWLGAIVPIGGAMMIAGWALVAVAGWRAKTYRPSK